MKNKKGVIGATMTWVVATVIILMVIIIFVYAVGAFSGLKWVFGGGVGEAISTSSSIDSEQMLLALLQTEIDGKIVKEYILSEEFDVLEPKIETLLDKLPNPYPAKKEKEVDWVFRVYLKKPSGNFEFNPDKIYRNENFEMNLIGLDAHLGTISTASSAKLSYAILDENKKVTLHIECNNGACIK